MKATISAIGFFVASQTALAGTVSVTFDQDPSFFKVAASASDIVGSDSEEQNLRARAKLLWEQFASDICSFGGESEQRHFAVFSNECGLTVPEIVFLPIESINRPNVLAGVYEIDGAFKIFFVEDYYSSLSPRLIDQLLIEELSHVARWNSTFGGDSADFGAEVAAKLLGARASFKPNLANASEGLVFDGVGYRHAKFASFTFPASFKVTNVADKETNLHEFDYADDLGPVYFDDVSDRSDFSGNDVSGRADFLVSDTSVNGWMSRPIKVGGDVKAFYLWTDADFTTLALARADSNADADSDPTDNDGYIFVVDEDYFAAEFKAGETSSIGSSSDKVDAALNSVNDPFIQSITSATEPEGGALVHTVTIAYASDKSIPKDRYFLLRFEPGAGLLASDYSPDGATFSAGVTRDANDLLKVLADTTSFTITVPSSLDAEAEADETYEIFVAEQKATGTITDVSEAKMTIAKSVSLKTDPDFSGDITTGDTLTYKLSVSNTGGGSTDFRPCFRPFAKC